MRECIHFFKYQKKAYLARPLGEMLIDGMSNDEDLREADFLIPVPLDGRRFREREFNQAHLLAQVVSRDFKITISSRNLRRARRVPPQTQLSRKQREENVKGLFEVRSREEYKGRRILLIDDVFTTGATVNECARVLKEAGAEEVSVLTVARGE
ncbi:ComF family protein [bacterium]|nr:ComF family protein [bacterium]MCK4325666.1 ComF family protein [bacterium]MCK4436375.1 ComF family protein [bacterium]